jgi:hypothetical protein
MAVPRIEGPALPAAPARPQQPQPARSFVAVLEEGARPPATAPPSPAATGSPPKTQPSAIRALVETTLAAERQIDAVLAAARRGASFSPAQLIELQARVFQHSQTVEVLSRGVDRVVGAARQALTTQV